jgi:hypothetical protein
MDTTKKGCRPPHFGGGWSAPLDRFGFHHDRPLLLLATV